MWEFLDKMDLLLGIGTFLFSAYTALQFRQGYKGWKVIILKDGQVLLRRPIGMRKAKEIADDPADLSVFLKGTVSPYAMIGVELPYQGQEIGLLRIDRETREYIIDLDKNPERTRRTGL
jgi:hypothetical protein